MSPVRYRRPTLGFALAALMTLLPACTNKPAEKARPAEVAVHGRILAADGSTPKLAHVRFEKPDGQKVSLDAETDGSFEISVPAGTPINLYVAAVDHEESPVPVLLEGTEPASIQVTLAPNPWAESFDEVLVVGAWNHHSFSKTQSMTRREDGTWVWDGTVSTEAPTTGYELLGITTNGHSVNGTMAESFAYDGEGDFDCIVPVTDGKVHIVFDPAKLPRYDATGLPKAAWDAGHRGMDGLARIAAMLGNWKLRAGTAYEAYRKSGDSSHDFHFDTSELREAMEAAMGKDSPMPLRRYTAVEMLANAPFLQLKLDAKRVEPTIALVPPDSPYWGFEPEIVGTVAHHLGDRKAPLLARFVKENPVPAVQAWALAAQAYAAQQKGDTATLRRIYDTLTTTYAAVPNLHWALKSLDPDKKIQVGRKIPPFQVTLLDGSKISDTDLKGHWTLIDFWATWCGPCVGEMPNLDAAWKKFHPEGLQMLSLSLDRKKEDIDAFRKKKWKMPWKHAFLEGGFKDPVTQSFEVMGIPSPVLVDPDGTIVALGSDLRGDELAATLARYLGHGKKGV